MIGERLFIVVTGCLSLLALAACQSGPPGARPARVHAPIEEFDPLPLTERPEVQVIQIVSMHQGAEIQPVVSIANVGPVPVTSLAIRYNVLSEGGEARTVSGFGALWLGRLGPEESVDITLNPL